MDTETKPIILAEVLKAEFKHIRKTDLTAKDLTGVFREIHKESLSALCFSGGGIRSATFGLGIVQALAKHKLLSKFDYLSTVSGGGYLGSWLSAWIRREQMALFDPTSETYDKTLAQDSVSVFNNYQNAQDYGITKVEELIGNHKLSDPKSPNQEPPELQYLRMFSNFMSPKVGLLSADTWTLGAIYLRNLFLNWTIFLPLISVVLLLPKLFLEVSKVVTHPFENIQNWSLGLLVVSVLSGAFAISYVFYQLPSNKNHRKNKKYRDTEIWVIGLGVLPMVLLAFGSATLWSWATILEKQSPLFSFTYLPTINFSNFLIFGMIIGLIGSLSYFVLNLPHSAKKPITSFWQIVAAIFSGVINGGLIWLVIQNLPSTFFETPNDFHLFATFAVPIFLILFLASATLFVGLASKYIEDSDREWLARYAAWTLIICLTWIILHSLVLFVPDGVRLLLQIFNKPKDFSWYEYLRTSVLPVIVTITGIISGLVSLFGGFSSKSSATEKELDKSMVSKFLSIAPPIAGVIFLGFIFVGLALGTDFLMQYLVNDYFTNHALLYSVIWICALFVVGVVMAFFVNVNKFSLHAMYRDRLIRAYLGASKERRNADRFTNFDDKDNFQLHRLKGQKPFHIINATLNLLSGGNNLAWQNRKGESFTMSPLHCGSWHLGYRPTNEYARNTNLGKCENIRYCNQENSHCGKVEDCKLSGKSIRLGTAMAISGAAANPNMGYYSSPIVTFLLALFNVRLGWWLGNTGKKGDIKDYFGNQYFTKPCPTVAVLPLLNETLGQTDEGKRYINVTDGGHFENLGLYEPILRRCKFIVVSDGAEDINYNFGEISNAIEKCKVDLGVSICFDNSFKLYPRKTAQENEKDRLRFAVANIIYPEKDADNEHLTGTLLYIRPTFYGNEPTDVVHYAKENLTFPHQSTADQQYDEQQFEAYRELGFFIMNRLIEKKDKNGLYTFFNSL